MNPFVLFEILLLLVMGYLCIFKTDAIINKKFSESKREKAKRTLPMVGKISLLLAVFVTVLKWDKLTSPTTHASRQVLEEVINKSNENLPRTIDANTILYSVTMEEPKTLVYHYEVNSIDAGKSMDEIRNQLRTSIVFQLKNSPAAKPLRNHKITAKFIYNLPRREKLEIVLRPGEY
jgi:hypothetical protein